ncbi:gag-protease polyprotein [Cucumis melo var. makuwa]|uniref:Gag-protease polyprotein n=1 Tax=Cucumis melo var. makuwa TaxID=1194695 RepID=A0A5A7U7G8_CUCMM|nr:gag-protease polyprotein [Cucumis melo var. makuwa]
MWNLLVGLTVDPLKALERQRSDSGALRQAKWEPTLLYLGVEVNKDLNYISGKGFLTTGPQTETGNVPMYLCPIMSCYVDDIDAPMFYVPWTLVMELCRGGTKSSKTSCVDVLGFELRRSTVRVTVSFIYGVAYLTGTVSFGIPRVIYVSFGITRLIYASFEITRLICVSFGITRLICASFEITRLICASFRITRLICVSFGIKRMICTFFGITRLICASDGITRLIDVRVWKGTDRRGASRMREGHMDVFSFFMLPLTEMSPRRGARRGGRGGRGRGAGRVQPEMREQQQPAPPASAPTPVVPQVALDQLSAEAKHLRDLTKYNPTTFDGSLEDPTKTQMWLSSLETIFRGTALWETAERMLGGDVSQITWKQFKESFYAKFFSASLRDPKRQEFLNLELDDRIVKQYDAEFDMLSHFAPKMIATEADRADKFVRGLKLDI